jgi:HKD family nuclease
MARLELILQAATPATHAAAVRKLLTIADVKTVLVSVAFANEAGVEAIEAALKGLAGNTKFFVGIRNNITTMQGLKRLLTLRTELYAVDTGSGDTIFHPKLYLICTDTIAEMIVGSANLTFQGLHNNIEASTRFVLDLTDAGDREFVEQTTVAFDDMLAKHPEHVFQVKDAQQVDQLFDEGRIADETIVPAPKPTTGVRKGKRDSLGRMKLYRVFRPRIKVPVKRGAVKAPPKVGQPIPAVGATEYYLVWESNALKERDLNVPTGPNTHATGSMALKKGAMDNIDQRHFFRDEIFDTLKWVPDLTKPHYERATAQFELVIKNLNYGKFNLRLSHNKRTDTKTYKQNNAMTHLHWDEAAHNVGDRDLLGRTMYLYRKDTNPPEFQIEID